MESGSRVHRMRAPWRRKSPARPVKTVRHVPPVPVPKAADLSDLEAQARYHRDRLALYRARVQGSHPTSTVRLRELERAAAAADDRLRTARRSADG
jgi:hypothetical protein